MRPEGREPEAEVRHRGLPDAELRHAAADLVRKHGADTLSFFKLRGDKQYLFNPERTAFVGYRIENGVLVVSGDPIGDAHGLESLMRTVVRFAEERGLRLAALGVSPEARDLFEHAGLRALYLGDEAIVETARFSLEGRPIRKVRQSVSRLQKAGYRTTLSELGSLDDAERKHIVAVLRATAGNQTQAAFILGIERKTLARKIKRYNITSDEAPS